MANNEYLFNSIDLKHKKNFGLLIRLAMGDFLAIDHYQKQIEFMFSKEESVKQF
jgi:hypothetical protein